MDNISNVLIIDGLNAFIRAIKVDQTLTLDGKNCGGITGFLGCIRSWINKFNPQAIFICWDGANGSIRKRKIYPDYKQNRRPLLNNNSENKDRLWQLETLVGALKLTSIKQIYIENCEADDVIFYITEKLKDKKKIILSSDKDYYQLIDENTTIFSLSSHMFVDETYLLSKFKCSAKNFAIFKSILGDRADNIPRVKNFGERRVELLTLLKDNIEYETNDIIEFTKKTKNPKFKSLIESKDLLERNYSLIKLSLDQLSINQINNIDTVISKDTKQFETLAFRKHLIKHKISMDYIDTVVDALKRLN